MTRRGVLVAWRIGTGLVLVAGGLLGALLGPGTVEGGTVLYGTVLACTAIVMRSPEGTW